MLWIAVGLFVVGVACGAVLRLLVFVGILIGGAVIAGIAEAAQGLGAALLAAVLTVIALQVGYVAGFVLRAAGRSLHFGNEVRRGREPSVNARLGEKRQ